MFKILLKEALLQKTENTEAVSFEKYLIFLFIFVSDIKLEVCLEMALEFFLLQKLSV